MFLRNPLSVTLKTYSEKQDCIKIIDRPETG